MSSVDERDARIAQLETMLSQERSYSQMIEMYLEEKLATRVTELIDDRVRIGISNQMGGFDGQTMSMRFDQFISQGSSRFNIDTSIERIENTTWANQSKLMVLETDLRALEKKVWPDGKPSGT